MKQTYITCLLLVSLLLCGCDPDGPTSTQTKNSAIPALDDRISFLDGYVPFRRTYESLDFDITYHNNGGALSAPSDWDVRLIAIVPAAEIPLWIPAGVSKSDKAPELNWIASVPTSVDVSGVDEWYATGQKAVGIDREKRVIVYRTTSTPF